MTSTPATFSAAAFTPVCGFSRLGTLDEVIAYCVQEAVGLCGTEFACKCEN